MTSLRASIKSRVRAVILTTSLVALLLTAASFVTYEVVSFRTQLVRTTRTLAAVIGDNAAAALAFETRETAGEILAALRAEPDIVAATVFDSAGAVFAKYSVGGGGDSSARLVRGNGFEFDADGLLVFQPIMWEGKAIGYLSMRSSLRGMSERFSRYGMIVAGVLAGSFALALVIANLLQRRITTPILDLTRGAERIRELGDYSIRVPRRTDDEIGRLVESFNAMISQIEESRRKLVEQARLIDLSHDGIVVRDPQGRITFWSVGAREMYGYTVEEALGCELKALLKTEYPKTREEVIAEFERAGRWNGELLHTRKDGTSLYVASRWSLLRNEDGTPKAILESNTDITQRRAFQAELERLVQERTAKLQETVVELEAFSYSISHDMRSPLRAMQGYSRVLLADYKGRLDADATNYLERIVRSAGRLDLLIQDVLAYSKVAQGEVALKCVDLERLIGDVLSIHPELQESKAEINLARPLDRVIAHEAYLTQCITNLLGNAVKFVAPGKFAKVEIRTERKGNRVTLWFEDNGIGIDPSHQKRIFEIFGRIHPEKAYSGTGIGLAIVRKAARRMNGEVGVISKLGEGSRFWVELEGC